MLPWIVIFFIPLYIITLCLIYPKWKRCDPTLHTRIASMLEYATLSSFIAVVTAALFTRLVEIIQ